MTVRLGLLCILSMLFLNAFSQKDCSHDHTGLIPIMDLGADTYRGEVGGLYPGGSNERPADHLAVCLSHVEAIQPLDISGNINTEDGRIVMLAIGASNPHDEFTKLKFLTEDFEPANDHLVLINGCIPSVGIQDLNTGSAVYWSYIENELLLEGLHPLQVQVIWLEEENTYMPDTTFPGAPSGLVDDYHTLLMLVKEKFPNAQICYISARVYSGFIPPSGGGISNGLLYPRDYLNGWAVKWLIEKQITGELNYEYEGPDATIPLITWGSYHWTDGSTPRADGFSMDCEADFEADGLHLSIPGITKIGQFMFDYFASDTTAGGWFYDEDYVDIDNHQSDDELIVFPNPVSNQQLHIQMNIQHHSESVFISIYSIDGSVQYETITSGQDEMTINLPELAAGIYTLMIRTEEKTMSKKIVVTD